MDKPSASRICCWIARAWLWTMAAVGSVSQTLSARNLWKSRAAVASAPAGVSCASRTDSQVLKDEAMVINARSPCLSPSASVLSALDVVQIGREGEDAVGDVGLSKGGQKDVECLTRWL